MKYEVEDYKAEQRSLTISSILFLLVLGIESYLTITNPEHKPAIVGLFASSSVFINVSCPENPEVFSFGDEWAKFSLKIL